MYIWLNVAAFYHVISLFLSLKPLDVVSVKNKKPHFHPVAGLNSKYNDAFTASILKLIYMYIYLKTVLENNF